MARYSKNDSLKKYNDNPKQCKLCGIKIEYDKRQNNFCCKSHSTSYVNKFKIKSSDVKNKIRSTLIEYGKKIKVQNELDYLKNPKKCVICLSELLYVKRHLKTCSKSCLLKHQSIVATNNPLMGGNKNRRSGWYTSPIAGKVYLESGWEVRVAEELDANNIKWHRPKCLYYMVDNTKKKYFPDFFLDDYNVYLDPKNEYLRNKDKKKIDSVIEANDIRVLILDETKLTWKSILELITIT